MDTIKIQTRFRVTPGAGQWPAIWMLPSDNEYGGWAASGEIDIMEAANSMDSCSSAIHYGAPWPQNVFYTKRASADVSQWTTVTYYWEEDFMRWEVNGEEYMTAQSGQGRTREGWYTTAPNAPPNAPFDENFYLLVNLAVGGGYTGNVALDAALQALNEGSKELEVDYIRVYGKSDAPTPTPSPSPSPIIVDPVDSCSFCSNIKQQGKPYGYYADPSSGCRGYYTCRNVGAWYNECPPDLLFNEASAVCDQPENVEC
jgi:beta-glucanase (GH16 family)